MSSSSYERCMEEGRQHLLNIEFKDAVKSFNSAIELNPSSIPKQWMRGIALYFARRYQEGTQQFVSNLSDNPEDVEEVVWAFMCTIRHLEGNVDSAREQLLPCPTKDLRIPMTQIYNMFAGKCNIADVLHATASFGDETATSYAHLYIALYLDCCENQEETNGNGMNFGLSGASRSHYILSGKTPSNDFMGELAVASCEQTTQYAKETQSPKITDDNTMARIPRQRFSTSNNYSSSLIGCWQLSGGHHYMDKPTRQEQHRRLTRNIHEGFTTLDMGDIYTGVEEAVGIYFSENPSMISTKVEIHTKLVPDLQLLENWSTEQHTIPITRRSINRLRHFQKLDLIQFHWWDWNVGNHIEAYRGLCSLVPSMVQSVGVTNYDRKHLNELLDSGLPVVSNQVQYSLLDRRAETMFDICTKHNIRLLCYGSLAGGFLSDRWLGNEDPVPNNATFINSKDKDAAAMLAEKLTNRSLIKYYLMIHEFGGWTLFQELLQAMRKVADRHSHVCNIATVAQAWVLSRRCVGGVILGLSGNESHIDSAKHAHQLACLMDEKDYKILNDVLNRSQGPKGEFYDMERVRDSPHGKIMRYNCGQLHTEQHAEEFIRRVNELSSTPDEQSFENWLVESMLLEANGFDDEMQMNVLAGSIKELKTAAIARSSTFHCKQKD